MSRDDRDDRRERFAEQPSTWREDRRGDGPPVHEDRRGGARPGREDQDRQRPARRDRPRDDRGRATAAGAWAPGRNRPGVGGADRRFEQRGDDRPARRTAADDTASGFVPEPPLPEGLSGAELDAEVRRDLRGLQKQTAETVAQHLVAAGRLVDGEPEKALEHARYARRRASRIAAVREAAGIAAYHAGEWSEALGELRAARRMGGGPGHLAVMADIERALGRPERAIELARSPEAAELGRAESIELLMVAAGARRDLGELDAAVVTLQIPELDPRRREPWSARLFYAYADNLLAAGRQSDALQWFVHAVDADPDGATDAALRIAELTGEPVDEAEDEIVFEVEDVPDPEDALDGGPVDAGDAAAGDEAPGSGAGPELPAAGEKDVDAAVEGAPGSEAGGGATTATDDARGDAAAEPETEAGTSPASDVATAGGAEVPAGAGGPHAVPDADTAAAPAPAGADRDADADRATEPETEDGTSPAAGGVATAGAEAVLDVAAAPAPVDDPGPGGGTPAAGTANAAGPAGDPAPLATVPETGPQASGEGTPGAATTSPDAAPGVRDEQP
ncbi:MAG TPA: tetratricopeptide repeat protein [Pseudonocardia sp.]|nr:tetratricopeptide repeat protein [Pseudonocardia sp.]